MTDTISSKIQKLEANDWSFFETETYKSDGEDKGRSFIHISGAKGNIDITIGFPTPNDANGTIYIALRDDVELYNVPLFDVMRVPMDVIRKTLDENGYADLAFLATREGFEHFFSAENSSHLIERPATATASSATGVLNKIAIMFQSGDDDHIKVDGADLLSIAQAITMLARTLDEGTVVGMMETMVDKYIDAIKSDREVA